MSTPNHPKPETEPAAQGGAARPDGPQPSTAPDGDPVTPGGRADREAAFEAIKARHDEISRNIRTVSLALISYALFCFLTLGQSDDIAFRETGKLQIPFSGGIDIGFSSFFVVGPLILIVLTFYLHIFIHELNQCELDASQKLPFVFNLDNGFARGVTFSLFYFLTPIVFLSFIWSIRASEKVTLWSAIALSVSLLLVWQFHRASPASRRSLRRQPIPLMILVGVFIMSAVPGNLTYLGPIELARSDLKNTRFNEYALDWMNADSAHLEFSDFSGNQYITHALFDNAFLMNTNFAGANLRKSWFRKSNLTKAELRGARLTDARFDWATLIDSDLSPLPVFKKKESLPSPFARLWSLFTDVPETGSSSDRPKATRLSLNPLSLSGNSPDKPSLQASNPSPETPIQYNTELTRAVFNHALMLKTKLNSARMDRAKFIGTEITASVFDKAHIREGDFTGALIRESSFKGPGTRLDSGKFIDTTLQECEFNGAILADSNFTGARLHEVSFDNADLSGARFTGADLDSVNFTGADLRFADFRGVRNLVGPRGEISPTLKRARNVHQALFENDIRRNLDIDDESLLTTLVHFLNHRYPETGKDEKPEELESRQNQKLTELENLMRFYGLSRDLPESWDLVQQSLFSRDPDAQSPHKLSPPESTRP